MHLYSTSFTPINNLERFNQLYDGLANAVSKGDLPPKAEFDKMFEEIFAVMSQLERMSPASQTVAKTAIDNLSALYAMQNRDD